MPLTVRNNGSSPTNVIKAAWFNDFYNLLTGIMVDQPVTIGNNITLGPPLNYPNPGPTVAPGGSLTASTAMSIGAYKYVYTFFSNSANLGLDLLGGESSVSPTFSITTTTGNQAVNLTGIATGPAGTVGRNIYRVKVGTTSPFFLLTTLNDNVTTTFADTTPDGGLSTVVSPPFSSFGGALADRKSTRLYSSHTVISYAVFCLKKTNHTSELQSHSDIVCRLLLEKKKINISTNNKE